MSLSPAPEPPTSKSSPAPPLSVVVASAAEDEIVERAADDLVIDTVFARNEVLLSVGHGVGRHVDAAGIPVAGIRATDEIVVGPEQIAVEGRIAEIDAFNAGLCVRASIVPAHSDLLPFIGDHQVAVLRTGVCIGRVETGEDRQERNRIDSGRNDRDSIDAPAICQFVDDIVAVTEGELIGVVTIAAIECFHHRRRNREIIDEEVLSGFISAVGYKADGCVRSDLCGGQRYGEVVVLVTAKRRERIPGRTVECLHADGLTAIEIVAFPGKTQRG